MQNYRADDEVVILDFETTGLSTGYDRIIEIGAAIVKEDQIVSTFSSLCNSGIYIPSFITGLTGITNDMIKGKPTPEEVMPEFYEYIGNRPLLAHNASFDSRFLKMEMGRVDKNIENPLLCTMLLARRLIEDAADHKLNTLKHYINFKSQTGHQDHRALDDVKVTASLWMFLRNQVEEAIGHKLLNFSDFQKLSRVSKYKVQMSLEELSKRNTYDYSV